jgi:hypothetical protein
VNNDIVENARNRKTQQSPGRRRARRHANASSVIEGAYKHGCRRLYVVRESAEYAWMLMLKMIEQTLASYASDASVAKALSVGILPLLRTDDGVAVREQLAVRVLYAPDGRSKELGVLFRIGEDWFLYALTTAGRTSFDGENGFVDALVETLRELRPAELVAGPFSRLVRRLDLASRVSPVLKEGRTTVRTYEVPGGMDHNTIGGEEQWNMLAKAAEWDYRANLTRLLTGVVYELKNNRYPRAASSLPPGYRKGAGGQKHGVEPDPSQRHLVRTLIELAASDKTHDDIVNELAELDVRSRHPRHVKTGDAPRIDRVANPSAMVTGLFAHLPLYLDGTYRFTHEMTLPHLDEFHGLAVHRQAPGDYGFLSVDLDFGLPDGGWHDCEVIQAAIHKRLIAPEVEKQTPRNPDLVKPLASLGQHLDRTAGFEYDLHSSDQGAYVLRRRPLEEAFVDGRRLPFDDNEGELLGRFAAGNLHAAVARALETIGDGVPSSLACASREPTDQLIADLRDRLEAANRAATGARDELVRALDDESKQQYRDIVDREVALATQLRSELVEVERRPAAETLQLLDGQQLAAVIATLKSTDDRAPVAVNRLLRRLITKFRIVASPREPIARLTLHVTLRTDDGPVILGPLEALATNGSVGVNAKNPGWSKAHRQRNHRIVELLLLGEGSPEEVQEIWRGENFDSRSYKRRMLEALRDVVPTSGALAAIIDCPILDTRRAVLGPLLKRDLPHGLDTGLAKEFARIYASKTFYWPNGWCPGGMTRRRQTLLFLDEYAKPADDGLDAAVLRARLDLDHATLNGFIHDSTAKPGYNRSKTRTYPCLEDIGGWLSEPRSKYVPHPVVVRRCPHCQQRKLLQPLKVPEVPGQLLCTNCRREWLTGRRYPDAYFLPWDGPQTLPRREKQDPLSGGRYAPSRAGRIIVGADQYQPTIPSLHAPTRRDRAS